MAFIVHDAARKDKEPDNILQQILFKSRAIRREIKPDVFNDGSWFYWDKNAPFVLKMMQNDIKSFSK